MKPQPRYQRGDRIANRYLVHQALLGGMGEVYLCLDLEENYPVALKTFQQRYLTDTQRLRRAFEHEVATWVALEKHPNIVRCFMMQLLENQPFMMLEWIASEEGSGTDLRSWLRRGPLDLKLALQIVIDVCQGLLHAQATRPGLVHRDLKPENILMAQGGLAKITDFGLTQIAQVLDRPLADRGVTNNERQSIFAGHGIIGTPVYMAPEQWRNEPLDVRTDIYALGVILYELLTGSPPFRVALPSATPQGVQIWLHTLQQAHEQAAVAPLAGALPAGLNDLVQRCLAKKPTTRYPTVAALHTALTSLYQAHFAQVPPPRPTPSVFTAADYNNRGLTYAVMENYAAALADFTQAIALAPNDVAAYSNRGLTYAEMQEYAAALADYNHALTLDPNYATAYCNRGSTYASTQDHTMAMTDYNRAIALDPNYATAYHNRGHTYAEMQEYAAAMTDYNRAIALNPNYATAYYSRGITYHKLQDYAAALADYNRAIDLNPIDAKAYYNRGSTYAATQDYTAAMTDYNRALELDPNYATAYYNRGRTYTAIQDFTAAMIDYNRALELDPTLAQAYSNRGATYHVLQDYAAALADYNRAIDLNPTDAKAYYNRGLTYQTMHDYAMALADFTQALELDPTLAQVYNNRGTMYATMQDYAAALADFTQAMTLDLNYADAYVNIGAVLGIQKRFAEALPYFEKATELGDAQGAQLAAETRRRLGVESVPQVNTAQQAFDAFQQANAVEAMWQAVARFPMLAQLDFIAQIEQAITEQVPPEHRPAFTQRLTWLRQIAKEQNQ